MSNAAEELTNRLNSAEGAGPQPALWLPLLKLLATGQPVAIAELAAATDRPAEEVRQALAAVPDTEHDEDGRIVGQGLTLRPTRHHFTVDDRRLYTWCALDTLIFPGVLDKAVTIESVSPTSGTPVRLHVDGTGVSEVEPATAVVSLLTPDDESSVRSAFCNQVHFLPHGKTLSRGWTSTPADMRCPSTRPTDWARLWSRPCSVGRPAAVDRVEQVPRCLGSESVAATSEPRGS